MPPPSGRAPMAERAKLLRGLVSVVQYRRINDVVWHTMAAYDSQNVAERYAASCQDENKSFCEYRVIELPEEDDA